MLPRPGLDAGCPLPVLVLCTCPPGSPSSLAPAEMLPQVHQLPVTRGRMGLHGRSPAKDQPLSPETQGRAPETVPTTAPAGLRSPAGWGAAPAGTPRDSQAARDHPPSVTSSRDGSLSLHPGQSRAHPIPGPAHGRGRSHPWATQAESKPRRAPALRPSTLGDGLLAQTS